MSVVVVGLEHSQTPLHVLERVTVTDTDLAKVLGVLQDRANLSESVVLSTCLRTEVYAVVDRFHDAVHEIEDVLADRAGLSAERVEEEATVRFDDDVPTHLFSVASGLESVVPGEGEVLGQVKRAWERARAEGSSGPVLGELFRHALETGKRVRSETAIARGTTSFSHATVELIEESREGGLRDADVLVVGAGVMGVGVATAMAGLAEGRRPRRIVVANRTEQKAVELAATLASSVSSAGIGLDDLTNVLHAADVIVVATTAGSHVITASLMPDDRARQEQSLLVIDLGVPRTVDPAIGARPGVALFDMDALKSAVERAVEDRRGEIEQASAIVAAEVARYRDAARARGASPVVAALRAKGEEFRTTELDRARSRLGELSDEQWHEVEAVTKAVLAKLLHSPTVMLKETAGSARGERLVEALRALFDL